MGDPGLTLGVENRCGFAVRFAVEPEQGRVLEPGELIRLAYDDVPPSSLTLRVEARDGGREAVTFSPDADLVVLSGDRCPT